MGHVLKFSNPDGLYFITFTVVHWIDALNRPVYKDQIIDSLSFCQREKGLEVNAWCIMSNHVHFIGGARGPKSLSEIMRDFKKYTSKLILKTLSNPKESRRHWMLKMFREEGAKRKSIKKYQFWQHGNHPIEIGDQRNMASILQYIHNNPVAAGLVVKPEHYVYSSARDYSGDKGLLEITKLKLRDVST